MSQLNYGQANNAGMAQAAYAIPPAPTNPIPAALGQLGQAIHEMGLLADTLTARLGGVLMSAKAENGQNPTGEQVVLRSPHADEIHGLRRRVENIGAQIQDVLNRLEV